MKGLTARQREARTVIATLTQLLGQPPTVREVASTLGIRINAAIDRLNALERKGAIARTPFTARSIRILEMCP